MLGLEYESDTKIVNAVLKAKAKAIKFGVETPRRQGLGSRATLLKIPHQVLPEELGGNKAK